VRHDNGTSSIIIDKMEDQWKEQVKKLWQDDYHASLRYDDVAAAGPPARPLDFPAPTVHRATFVDLPARDHRSGSIHHLKNVLTRSWSAGSSNGKVPDTAYLATKKLAKSVYGTVRLCIVLKRINQDVKQAKRKMSDEDRQDDEVDDDDNDSTSTPTVEWESTDYLVAIKFSEWKKIHHLRGKHLEDPIKESATLQLIGNYHPHVLGSLETLQDDNYLYTVMPYLEGGDLYGRLLEFMGYRSTGPSDGKGTAGFNENMARTWFRQLLLAVDHLQKKGVCHRDISLENILLDREDKICLIDPGMSLRVPYTDPYGGGVADVSAGTSRRLMIAQGQGGKLMYTAPEIIAQEPYVDAFATDLWSVGVVLFVMLVGLAPFKWAHPTDKRFASISQGGLKNLVEALEIPVSPEAVDLMQGFFWADPRKRLTLAEVMLHPWVLGKQFVLRPQTMPATSSKRFAFGAKDVRNKKKPSTSKFLRNKNEHSELHRRMPLISPQI